MSDDMFDDVVSLLKANDEARGWTPDPSAAFTRLTKDDPDLPTSAPAEATAVADHDVLEVSIGDLTVSHRPEPLPPRWRRRELWAVSAAASVLLIGVAGVLISKSDTGGVSGRTQLRTVTPAVSGAPFPASSTAPSTPARVTPALTRPSVVAPAPSQRPANGSTRTAVSPSPLTAHVTVSRTTLYPGESLVVTYTWSDGDGQLLDLNRVEATAVKVIRPLPCKDPAHQPHPNSGHGSYVYTYPASATEGTWLGPGPNGPVQRPTLFQVGVEIDTGGNCAPDETVTATQLVTLVPSPTSATAPTADASPTATSSTA